jgi:beta-N-acetylhexosaminidase
MIKKNNLIFYFPIVLIIVLILSSCAAKINIVDKPISFSQDREELTKLYINDRYGSQAEHIQIIPKIIVLHWTAIDDFDSCFNTFNRERLEQTRPDLSGAGELNVSIHFLVDRDGTVYRLMPETMMARHCIGLNYNSIGVENVGGENNIDNLTDEQIEANIKLVKYLAEKYPAIEYLIGHHEYREFEGHPLWLETDNSYRTEKFDPGERFMSVVRNKVAGYKLKGVEEIRLEKGIE